ncbi:MFS transporter, partial [Candidatus Bathyarchaeota archaeon]|nr:MFS transporter [Candidatus Bathyarchaeota archaeon]
MATSHGMNHFYQLLIPIIIPKILAEYDLSLVSAGLLISVYSLSYALLQMISSLLSRIVGRKRIIILGLIITSASFLALAFVKDLAIFAVILFVAGAGGSTYHPSGMPLLSEFYEKDRGKVAGFHQTGGSIGSVLAPIIISPLVV